MTGGPLSRARPLAARLAALALVALMLPAPATAVIDPETYPPCSLSTSTTAPCTGAVGGGPSPTLLCWPQPPLQSYWNWKGSSPMPSPNAAGVSTGCVNFANPTTPKCPGGDQAPAVVPPGSAPDPYWGECMPILLPNQLMGATSFWDDVGDSAYILGGSNTLGGTGTSEILRMQRGMSILPWPATRPHAPGGTFNPLQFPPPGSLPEALAYQALGWDPVGRVAYLGGGSSGGAQSNKIVAYHPDTQTSEFMGATLPTTYDMMAGAWNPTSTPTCPRGCLYMFGGRYPLPSANNETNVACAGKTDKVFLYDPVSDTVRENPWQFPQTLFGMSAVSVGTDIYLFGGTHQDDYIAQNPSPSQQVWACDPTGLTGLPAPVPSKDIFRYSVLEGGTLTRVNPYTRPENGGPAWGGGTFNPGNRPGVIFDGRYIFVFAGAPSCGVVGGVFRFDPWTATAPTPVPWSALNIACGGAMGNVANVGAVGLTTAVFTGCSAYVFGGLIDPLGIVTPPDGPISDKIGWLGKCRPKALMHPAVDFSCINWPVRFEGDASVPGESDIYWVEWNFGDGTPVVGGYWEDISDVNSPVTPPPLSRKIIAHPYANPGGYTVTMTITDLSGFRSTAAPVLVKIKQDPTCKAYTGTDPLGFENLHNGEAYEPGSPNADSDSDGVPDLTDNCPGLANHDQADVDYNLIGDACQGILADLGTDKPVDPNDPLAVAGPDADHDGIPDAADNCVRDANHDQADFDKDLMGDVCDGDSDGDGIPNDGPTGSFFDNCPLNPNPDQADGNGDGVGDYCSIGAAKAPPKTVTGVQRNASSGDGGMPWTTAMAMVGLAALVTALVLVLVLRRGLRRE